MILEAFARLVYPAFCGVCSDSLTLSEQGICSRCSDRLDQICFRHADLSQQDRKFEYLDEAWALSPYESPVKELLTAVKFHKKRWLIRNFAEALNAILPAVASEYRYDVLCPVPIDRSRLMEREFNQAELFARLAKDSIALPVKTYLAKPRRTFAQSQLGRDERLLNLMGAFRVRQEKEIRGKSILLVDDILTTGATADEAARILKKSGARRVGLFAAAAAGMDS